nr:MAG TPA: hypothetical protein [Caudoviricetes sp.]
MPGCINLNGRRFDVPEWIVKYWVEWAFGVLAAGLLVVYRRLAKKSRTTQKRGLPSRRGCWQFYTTACTRSARFISRRAGLIRRALKIWNICTRATMRLAATEQAQNCTTGRGCCRFIKKGALL